MQMSGISPSDSNAQDGAEGSDNAAAAVAAASAVAATDTETMTAVEPSTSGGAAAASAAAAVVPDGAADSKSGTDIESLALAEFGTADASTASAGPAAAAAAASMAGADQAISKDFMLLQRVFGAESVTDMKNKHQQWETKEGKAEVSFEAVMKHPIVQALLGKVDALETHQQELSGLVVNMHAFVKRGPAPVVPAMAPLVLDTAAAQSQQQTMTAPMQESKVEKKESGPRRIAYDQLRRKSNKALEDCSGEEFAVDLAMKKAAAESRVQVQLQKKRDEFKADIFVREGYYVLKDFVPAAMQPLLP